MNTREHTTTTTHAPPPSAAAVTINTAYPLSTGSLSDGSIRPLIVIQQQPSDVVTKGHRRSQMNVVHGRHWRGGGGVGHLSLSGGHLRRS
eukprot:4132596-Pyramimonas_sp.AAC.1